MKILGIDANTFYLAVSIVEDGRYSESRLFPHDGPVRKDDHPKKVTNRNKKFANLSPRERLDVMVDTLDSWCNILCSPAGDFFPQYVYIEEPPFVNSPKTFAELTAVVMVTRQIFRFHSVPVSLVNVGVWKKETIGNGAADKSEIKQWAIAHTGAPEGLVEDEYDATCIAYRGAVAAGDVR